MVQPTSNFDSRAGRSLIAMFRRPGQAAPQSLSALRRGACRRGTCVDAKSQAPARESARVFGFGDVVVDEGPFGVAALRIWSERVWTDSPVEQLAQLWRRVSLSQFTQDPIPVT
jgi:hypothetical protein